MQLALLLPVVVSFVLLGAHFLHHGSIALTAAALLAPLMLLIRRRWIVKPMQGLLLVAALEWVRTAVIIGERRLSANEPWQRMALILGAVALWTLCSALLFQTPPLKNRYRRKTPVGQDSLDAP